MLEVKRARSSLAGAPRKERAFARFGRYTSMESGNADDLH